MRAQTSLASLRHAGRDLLSLALIDSRNATLRWLAAFERELAGSALAVAPVPEVDPPLWLAFEAGWFQEYWIARNVQRGRGEACDASRPRLASIEPRGDAWMRNHDDHTLRRPRAERWRVDLPDAAGVRQYLVDTLETTLDLLAAADESDAGLYFYRLALYHEDAQCEAYARMAQTLGLPLDRDAAAPPARAAGAPVPAAAWRATPSPVAGSRAPDRGGPGRGGFEAHSVAAFAVSRMPDGALLRPITTLAPRAPLLFPATRHRQGVEPGGFAFDHERPVHEVPVPEFEIDAQPVTWQQFAEFVEDGGYDDARWWAPEGWAWVQAGPAGAGAAPDDEASGPRRSPRHVEQMRRGVLGRRFGRVTRIPPEQPVLHASWYEADAWCRWAGRRLPAEVEWEHAAVAGATRGFRQGDAWEWTASTLRPYPGHVAGPWRAGDPAQPAFGRCKVLRGASFATRSAFCDARFRHWAVPSCDSLFSGFRSCAV